MSTAPVATATAAPSRAPNQRWLLGFFVLAIIWGSSYLFIKVGVREIHPLGAGNRALLADIRAPLSDPPDRPLI